MFERLERMPDDPILGLMAAFRADPDTRKVDLGVGVYRNDRGETPVLDAVRRAEQAVLGRQTSKTYVAPAGNAGYNQCMERLVFGEGHPTLKAGRLRARDRGRNSSSTTPRPAPRGARPRTAAHRKRLRQCRCRGPDRPCRCTERARASSRLRARPAIAVLTDPRRSGCGRSHEAARRTAAAACRAHPSSR